MTGMMAMTRRAAGFSLVELLIAMAVMVTFTGALMSLILAGETIARMQPEAADVQQRARVAVQTLGAEFALAGAGLDGGPLAGPLSRYFAPIVPTSDGGITIWYVSSHEAQTTLAAPLPPGATDAPIVNAPRCPVSDPGCVFVPASTAIVFDDRGCRDVLRVDAVTATSLQVRAGSRLCAYAPGAAIAQGEVRSYRVDPATRQLLRRDEATGISLPVLDSVAALSVEYLDGGRLARLTLRIAAGIPNPRVPDFALSYDVRPPNLQGP
jgi:prepilin-type N-terminal cleavage/methylation domain-containing protein